METPFHCKKAIGPANYVRFSINGTVHRVSQYDCFTPESKLVDFIRDVVFLKGTKYMCREGGCGHCIVTVRFQDSKSNEYVVKAVNSCLIPVFACDGWDIFTIEHLGNKKKGYHPIQKRIVAYDGTQCGFCTPGQNMSMYSLLESKDEVTVKDVENVLDGNLCRCTGYRPILDAFKSFAVDARKTEYQHAFDIEDYRKVCGLSGGHKCCSILKVASNEICMNVPSGQKWIKVTDLPSALIALKEFKIEENDFRIVAGNTGPGVFRSAPAKCYLDISCVRELLVQSVNSVEVVLGSSTTLTVAIEFFNRTAEADDSYKYMKPMSTHLQGIANTPVRNVGTLGGNLMLKHTHRDFTSDVFLLLATIGAELKIVSPREGPKLYKVEDFLKVDMNGKLIISLHFRPKKGDYRFRSFKISRRFQNDYAFVNAGFLMKVDPKQKYRIMEKPSIVFGGISPDFIHAKDTEFFLNDKSLGNQTTLQGALKILDTEIQPNQIPGEPSPFYRKSLTKSLLYKTALEICRDRATKRILSGMTDIVPGSSKGTQVYDTEDDGNGPLYKPIAKLEAEYQASGEAEYINDIPFATNELSGAYVLTTVANAEIDSVDASEALEMDGVVRFVTAADIPGINNYMIPYFPAIGGRPRVEPIFYDTVIESAGLPVGMILAKSRELAIYATQKVKVTYKNVKKPIVNIVEAIKKVEDEGDMENHIIGTLKSEKTSNKVPTHEVSGEFQIGVQYAFHMETHCCICYPKDDSMDVFSGTQFILHTQSMVAAALGVSNNYINMEVRRLGGAFGPKYTRSSLVAATCAVAAYVTNQPVRVIQDFETNMEMFGKRPPYLNKYKVKFDDDGKILELRVTIFSDTGFAENETEASYAILLFQSAYEACDWEVKAGYVTTNTPSNTAVRAPGSTASIALIEYIMEHISFELKKDPLEVRRANYIQDGDALIAAQKPFKGTNLFPAMVDEIKMSSDYEERKKSIEKFNQENRWKKKGIAAAPAAFAIRYGDANGTWPVYVAVYQVDASIAVVHSGIEMGQGINTKVAQAVATTLKVPMDLIKIKKTDALICNNGFWTGGSVTSELCCDAAVRACKILLEKMRPIKESLGEDASWEKVVSESYKAGIDLSASHMSGPRDNVQDYLAWTVNITEVEVDILTGEFKVLRVDMLEDVGKSLNPRVDIGQIEGGWSMAQGLWTMEKIIHDKNTGQLLTNRTWNYKIPTSKDIPEDFRVTLLHNASNSEGVLRTKALSEPAVCSCVALLFALRNAIASARIDSGHNEWFQIDGPVTQEDVLRYALTSSSSFTY